MGATKRICELYMTALNRASDSLNGCKLRTRYVVVRFGNVLGSSGSVIPVFRRQIETGNPVTVTDPDASRFFMTITEAVGLVLVSASMRGQGEIFVLDMGEPVRIGDLVDNLAMSMGVSPGEVDRRYIGLRPGEKMHEVLWQEGEALIPSAHQGIFTLRQEAAGSLTEVAALLDELEVLAIRGDVCRLLRRVQEAVPSYQPPIKVRRFEVSEAGEKYRILIVDDDQAFRAVMGEALEGTYQVETASTAEGALAKAEKFRPHLVLLDMSLPDVNGVEVCHRLRADRKLGGVGIILVTGYTDVNTVETGLRAGADDYLAKPFSVNELRARIEAVLRRAERLTGAFGWV
jgi:CheY-like chemotaxis protein